MLISISLFRLYALSKATDESLSESTRSICSFFGTRPWHNKIHLKYALASRISYCENCMKYHEPFLSQEAVIRLEEEYDLLKEFWGYFNN